VDWGFTDGGLRRIVSIYEPENVASGKVMGHLGFRPFLTTTDPLRGMSVIVTELTLEEWEVRRQNA
jgi:RimJ/RimL family protein N-acetyltransferase